MSDYRRDGRCCAGFTGAGIGATAGAGGGTTRGRGWRVAGIPGFGGGCPGVSWGFG